MSNKNKLAKRNERLVERFQERGGVAKRGTAAAGRAAFKAKTSGVAPARRVYSFGGVLSLNGWDDLNGWADFFRSKRNREQLEIKQLALSCPPLDELFESEVA